MEKDCYTIADLAIMSGLSQRTIRNYIKAGRIKGKKIQGTWVFTQEDLLTFFNDDFIRQSILIKNQAIIHDFIQDSNKKNDSLCSIYDISVLDDIEAETIGREITGKVNHEYHQIQKMSYNYDKTHHQVRIILVGDKDEIIDLLSKIGKSH